MKNRNCLTSMYASSWWLATNVNTPSHVKANVKICKVICSNEINYIKPIKSSIMLKILSYLHDICSLLQPSDVIHQVSTEMYSSRQCYIQVILFWLFCTLFIVNIY